MILENGVVRTLDPSLPRAGARWLSPGERIAGGVGVHETALASPDRVDLGGRCVLPGFTDSHVHFPTWALAQRQVRLEGTSLDEALARVASAVGDVPGGRWLRGLGWRSGEWSPAAEPTKEALDAVAGDVPVALMSKDYHSLWLNSGGARAGQRRASGAGGSRRARRARRADRRPARGVRLALPRHLRPTDRGRDGRRQPARRSRSRSRAASSPCTTRTAGSARSASSSGCRDEGALNLRVWQSLPWDHLDRLQEIGIASGLGDDLLRVGYIKAFLDGTLGSRTALMLDGSGVEIVGYEEFVDIVRRSARAGFPVAVHAIGDLANRRALDAFEETQDEWRPRGLRQRIEHAQLLAPEDVGRFARARRRRLGPVQPRPVRPRPGRRLLGREDRRRLRLPLARRLGRPRRQRLRRRPSRSSTRSSASGPASRARSTSATPGIPSRR